MRIFHILLEDNLWFYCFSRIWSLKEAIHNKLFKQLILSHTVLYNDLLQSTKNRPKKVTFTSSWRHSHSNVILSSLFLKRFTRINVFLWCYSSIFYGIIAVKYQIYLGSVLSITSCLPNSVGSEHLTQSRLPRCVCGGYCISCFLFLLSFGWKFLIKSNHSVKSFMILYRQNWISRRIKRWDLL